ncbi:ATP-binding protein [Nonomuraea sp. NPDC049695]|uniref:ATP-binding protein n=1 Tax=Nonomuraea sp. NPDC049695 TaxID=3154734 RepID=UPI003449A8B5
MVVVPSLEDAPVELVNRVIERQTLTGFLDAVRAGEGRALVLSGDAGLGKTALLDDMAANARGFRVLRVSGVQSEMELAFAGLHQLCSRFWSEWRRCPNHSSWPCGPRSGWRRVRHRRDSWSGRPSSACCRRSPESSAAVRAR